MPIDMFNIAGIATHLRRWSQAILLPREGDDADHDDEDRHSPDRMLLRSCLLQLDNLSESLKRNNASRGKTRRPRGRGVQFTSVAMVDCLRLAMCLKGRSRLEKVITHSLRICMPTVADECRSTLVEGKVARESTISRNQICLDAAMLMLQRDDLEAPSALYIWADSSPQAGYDFLIVVLMAIRLDRLREAYELARSLANAKYTPDLPDIDAHQVLCERAALIQKLRAMLLFTTLMPQCMGLGGTSLIHKVRCTLHLFWMLGGLAATRLQSVIARAETVTSFTTDMGTEMGLADAVVPSYRSALPPWLYPEAHGARVLPDDDDHDHRVDLDEEVESKRVFPWAMVIPGVLHIAHNLSLKMDKRLQLWEWWLSGLQALVTLLHCKHNRQAFLERCVKGTSFERHHTLRTGVPTTTDWRWNTVDPIIYKLLLLRAVLRQTFKASKMSGVKSDSEGEDQGARREKVGKLNPTKVESTVKSHLWWTFALMLHMLHRLLTRFQQWCESCFCHWSLDIFDETQLRTWSTRCRELGISDVEGPSVPCPLGGLRAAELAAGEWRSVFDELSSVCLQEILAECEFVDMEDVGKVTEDWERGKETIFGQLEVKLHLWGCLPWRFAALAHNDVGVARASAKSIKDSWDALDPSSKVPGQQHPLTIMILTTELKHSLYKAKQTQTHDKTLYNTIKRQIDQHIK